LLKLILCVLLELAAGFGYLAARSGDPIYTFYEWMSPARFHRCDAGGCDEHADSDWSAVPDFRFARCGRPRKLAVFVGKRCKAAAFR
jgi:hypothetical protein